jgi:hypothetical protein
MVEMAVQAAVEVLQPTQGVELLDRVLQVQVKAGQLLLVAAAVLAQLV